MGVLPERPWKLEALLRLFMGVCICLFLGTAAAFVLQTVFTDGADHPVWRTVAATLSFQGAALVLVHFFLRQHDLGWREAFGMDNQWPRALLLGVLVTGLFLPVSWGLQWASAQFMTRVEVVPVEQPAVQTLRASETWVSRAVLGVVAIALAPVAEEVLFRGILYTAVKQAGFPRLALWGTSLLFAAIHANLATLLPLLVLSLALTLLYEKTGNLLAPIAAHALFNGVNFLRLFSAGWSSG